MTFVIIAVVAIIVILGIALMVSYLSLIHI